MRIVVRGAYFGFLVCLIFSLGCEADSHAGPEDVELDSFVSNGEQACGPGDEGCEEWLSSSENPGVVPEQSSVSCPGYKSHDNFPEAYEEFCQQMVTQDLLATGDTCFFAPAPEEAGCFCKICALKGPTVQCVSEECN